MIKKIQLQATKILLTTVLLFIGINSWGQCETYTLPFSEGFEDATFPPTCWDSFIGTNGLGTLQNWQRRTSGTYNSSAGAAYVQFEDVSGGDAEDWLVTPAIEIPNTTNEIQLQFQERQIFSITNYGSQYYIKIATENPTDPASYTTVINYGEDDFGSSIPYSQRTVDLSDYKGQTVYIAFVLENDNADGWFIDDVSVSEVAPIAIDATDISTTGFTANWEAYSGAASYRLDVSTDASFTGFYVSGYENLDVSNVTSYEVTGLTEGTDYYYRLRAIVDSEATGSSNTITVTTGVTNVWDGAVWSAGYTPTEIDDAVIEGAYSTADEGTFDAATLTINTGGSMVIASGDNITITGAVVNNEDASTFVIENNANLIQIDDVANTGDIQVEKDSSPLYRLDYTLWSAPVAGQNLLAFSPETLTNRFYDYDESTDVYTAIAPGSNDFQLGYGYLIRMPNDHVSFVEESTPGEVWTGTFEGVPNNGTINVPMETALNGYNLVGNPYPSPINISAFYTANTGILEGGSALYFWRKRNNPDEATYCTITNAAYTANSAAGGDTGTWFNGVSSSNWVINQGQGFFVKAVSSPLVFNNAMRAEMNNGQFFRTAQNTSQSSRLWLNLTGEDKFSQMAIAYNADMTLGIDYGWDGKALVADGPITIYTLVQENSLAIQARPEFTEADQVPVGIYVETAGNYTISLDHVDGLFAEGQDIYLIDYETEQLIDLNEIDYSFTTEAGTINDRFAVVYNQAYLGTETPELNPNEVVVYQANGDININVGNLDITAVKVYDMRGRILYTNDNVNANQTKINIASTQQQILIVNVTTNKGTVSKKVVY